MTPSTPAPRVKFDLHPYVYVSDSGQPVRLRADDGAVTQEGSKPCFQCDCGAVLVWVKSARTGRNYLAHCVKRSDYDSYYYMKNMPHTQERHAEKLADREAFRKWDAPNAEAYEAAREAYEQMKGEQS